MESHVGIWFQLWNQGEIQKEEATMSAAELRKKIVYLCRTLLMADKQLALVFHQLKMQSQPQHLDYLRRLREVRRTRDGMCIPLPSSGSVVVSSFCFCEADESDESEPDESNEPEADEFVSPMNQSGD